MKKFFSLLLFLVPFLNVFAQGGLIYSLERDQLPSATFERFVSFDYNTGLKNVLLDSLICCNGDASNTTIDPYNGRYFFVGTLNARSGPDLYSIDLNTAVITHHGRLQYFSDLDYDPYTNSIIYRTRDALRRYSIATSTDTVIVNLPFSNSTISSTSCVYDPINGKFSYMDYKYRTFGLYTYDVWNKVMTDSVIYPTGKPLAHIHYNINTQAYYGMANYGLVVRFHPHTLKLDTIASISRFHSMLNWQNCMIDPVNEYFLLPYYTSGRESKLAVVDIKNKSVRSTIDYLEKSNAEQYYGMPQPVASLQGNLLVAPYGESYNWYLNDVLIEDAIAQTYKPKTSGVYTVEVKFPLYTTMSKPVTVHEIPGRAPSIQVNLEVYPNPNFGDFWITSNQPLNVSDINVFNYLGQQIDVAIKKTDDNNIRIYDVPRGSYYITHKGDSEVNVRKIVVTNQ